jgi:hypothetical protein
LENDNRDVLAEYVSRESRIKLVRILLETLGSKRALARRINISSRAVRKWNGESTGHPSNVHLRKILALALSLNREETIKILKRDLQKHQKSVRQFIRALGGSR